MEQRIHGEKSSPDHSAKEKNDMIVGVRGATSSGQVTEILNDITGNLDTKRACTRALKLHKKYLRNAKKS